MEGSVLLPVEAEAFVEGLEILSLKDVGSTRWFRQHEHIEKLNMQAILSASAMHDEFIKDMLVTFAKIPVLVHEMILTEVWKHRIFPILCQLQDFTPKNTFPLYMVIHYEATIINLLETILFHKESCEAADDAILDLVDYCHRKLIPLAANTSKDGNETRKTHNNASGEALLCSKEELQIQAAELEFDISLKALSVLRYITDNTDSISALNRMLCTHNVPCLLVRLLEICPWSRCRSGEVEKYMNGKWETIPVEDRVKMTKVEGQVWLSLYNLLLKEDCQRKYDFNTFNKSQLLKVPEMWNRIVKENAGKWKAIAKYQVKETFSASEEDLRHQARRLAQTYNLDVMESLLPDKPKCGCCGKAAAKRCSRCQEEWYCHRECQVKQWPKHKKACQVMVEANKRIQTDLCNNNNQKAQT
ncbi:zinc finger MYND domain-containing protein 10 isoform X2 [Entelurus aequoreus]|uniref:zinc finger MYND domain-containing protein 10 isoform X2 n=1 Tax=Entelurus aequoreus TaxID=161455 RepID=UPI002B1D6454|nr:zinc finger MYND domain-containing protein 10 isoform X2 [Entelurus aequoreus]